MSLSRKRTTRGKPPKIFSPLSNANASARITQKKVDTAKENSKAASTPSGVDLSDILRQLREANLIKAGEATQSNESMGYKPDKVNREMPFYSPAMSVGGQNNYSLPKIDNPHIYLERGRNSAQALNIVDYVNIAPPTVSSFQASSIDTFSDLVESLVQLKTGPRRPKLEDVSISDWCIANMRIMDQLFGKYVPSSVRDYCAYSVKVAELFRDFERVSVLQYDQEYRHVQAEVDFRWGADIPHLHTTKLIRKSTPSSATNFNQVGRKVVKKKDGVCLQYNSKTGCTFGTSRCKFQHICLICKENHPKFSHGTENGVRRPPSAEESEHH